MQKRILVLMFGCLLLLYGRGEAGAEEIGKGEEKKFGFSMGGSIGAVGINGQMYYRVALQPVLKFGKLKAGLNLKLDWNDTEGIKPYTPEDWVNLILFIQWAEKGEKPVYFRIGDLQTATLGHGFIVCRYSNMTPKAYLGAYRNIGVEFDLNMNEWGFESIFNNILGVTLCGVRGYVRPFKLAGAEIPILSELAVGGSYATDINTGVYVDSNTNLVGTNVNIWGADIDLPIIPEWLIYYIDFAQIVNHGWGAATGVMGGKDWDFLSFNYKFEYRNTGDDFLPRFFDNYYEFSKPKLIHSSTPDRYTGWCGELTLGILKAVYILVSYDDSFKGPTKLDGHPWLHANLTLTENLFAITKQKISISGDYDHKNLHLGKIEDIIIQARLSYGISQNVDMIYVYTQKYTPAGQPVRSTSIEARMHF